MPVIKPLAILIACLLLTSLLGCATRIPDEILLQSLNARENQARSCWYGDVQRTVTADGMGYGGPESKPWGLRYSFTPGSDHPVLCEARDRTEKNRSFVLPTLSNPDPEVVLTGLYLLYYSYPRSGSAETEHLAQVLREKCCNHPDVRIRWEAYYLITLEWDQAQIEDIDAVMSDSAAAIRDFAPFVEIQVANRFFESAPADLQDFKKHFTDICIKHMADEDWSVRQACTNRLEGVLSAKIQPETWRHLSKGMPEVPLPVPYAHADWKTRHDTQAAWQNWWNSHQQTLLASN